MSNMFRRSTSNMATTADTNSPSINVGSSSGSISVANNTEIGQDVCGIRQNDVSYKNFKLSRYSEFKSSLNHFLKETCW